VLTNHPPWCCRRRTDRRGGRAPTTTTTSEGDGPAKPPAVDLPLSAKKDAHYKNAVDLPECVQARGSAAGLWGCGGSVQPGRLSPPSFGSPQTQSPTDPLKMPRPLFGGSPMPAPTLCRCRSSPFQLSMTAGPFSRRAASLCWVSPLPGQCPLGPAPADTQTLAPAGSGEAQ